MDDDIRRYKVVVSPLAAQELDGQVAWLAQESETAARRHLEAFREAASSLATFPLRRRFLDDGCLPRNTYRGLLYAAHYLAIYQVKDDTVFIDAVADCKQDYGWLFGQASE